MCIRDRLQSGFGGLELGAEGYLRKGSQSSYLASYRYSVPDILHALGVKMPVVPRYQDFTTKLHFDLGHGHKLSFVGLFSKSHIDVYKRQRIRFACSALETCRMTPGFSL